MKYKLIKEYPGSDPVGTIVEKSKSNEIYVCEQSNFSYMTVNEIENYPEFWERVIEKNENIGFSANYYHIKIAYHLREIEHYFKELLKN